MCSPHHQIGVEFLECLSQEEVAKKTVALVSAQTSADVAALVWAKGASFTFLAMTSRDGTASRDGSAIVSAERGWLAELVSTRQPISVGDLHSKSDWADGSLGSMGALCAFPILVGARVRGAVVAGCRDARELPHDEWHALESVAQFATVAMRKAQRYDRLHEEREKLEQVRLTLLETQSNMMKEKQRVEALALDLQTSRDAVVEAKDYTDNIIRSMLDYLVVTDSSGKISLVNEAVCQALDRSAGDLVGTWVVDCCAEADRPAIDPLWKSVVAGALVRAHELTLVTRNGETIPVSLSARAMTGKGGKVSVVGVARDMREIKKALTDLDQIYNGAPVGIRVIDTHLNVVSQNAAMTALCGAALGDTGLTKCHDLLGGQSCHTEQCTVNRVLLGSQSVDYEIEKIGAGGRKIPCRIQARPFRDFEGKTIGILEVAIDVSAEQKMQRDTERSNQELQAFAYAASHDLQEPLRKIITFGERLKASCSDVLSDQGRDYVDRMQNAAGRMEALVGNLLAFTNVTTQAQPFEAVDLGEVAQQITTDLDAAIIESGGIVEIGPLGRIEADPLQMRQLLQRIVANALKFHKKGERPRVRIDGREDEGAYEVRVSDNGTGFEEKEAEKIFGMFHRLHGRQEYEGTGIGLAICKKIAERHGGEITARSKPGEGATFIVRLPIRRGSVAT